MEVAMTTSYIPRVDLMGMSVKSSTAKSADVDVQFEIKNPHHLPIDLVDIDFTFENEDEELLVKKVQHPYAIQAWSSKSMKVPVKLEYTEMTGPSSGRLVPCAMRAELSFRQAVSGAFKVSVEKVKHLFNLLDQQQQQKTPEHQRVTGYVNGMHISSLSPTQVGFSIVLRISNGNPIPVRLDKANFTLESTNSEEEETGAAEILAEKVVDARQSIPGRSQKRVEIPLSIKFEEMKAELLPKPGQLLPFKLKMDFWFMDSTHGAYKISQEKSGVVPLLTGAKVEIKEVSFERDMQDRPEARMKVQLKSSVPAGFKLTHLDYAIRFAEESKGGDVARAELSDLELELSEETVLEVVADPVVDSVFGSALWDVFSDKVSTFKPVASIQGNSSDYGEITM